MKLNEIQRDLKAPKNQFNDFGKYKYRSCEDILQAVKPMLEDSVMTISDEMVDVGGKVYCKATVYFEDEDSKRYVEGWAREADTQAGMSPSQISGCASSYARKYALNGMFLIDDTKDDDATNKHEKPVTPKKASDGSRKSVTDLGI